MYKNKVLILVLIFTIFCVVCRSQTDTRGKIEIIQDSKINVLINKHIYLNKTEEKKFNGYRVQIFFDSGNNSKNRAFAKKGQFEALFPKVSAYLTFQSPNYKVRVGNFRTRMDAEGFKVKISEHFPNAFVVKDAIEFPDLEQE